MTSVDADYEATLEARCEALASISVHAGEAPDPETGALATPIVLASAFAFDDAEHAAAAFRGEASRRSGHGPAYIYGRWANPTVEALEAKLAALEGAEAACGSASGMAAVTGALLSVCESGAHVVAPAAMYGESARLLRERLPKLGITTTFVDATEPGAYEAALRPETRALYIETPCNPVLGITDVRATVALAKSRGLVTIADNTFATPFCQNPLALGVDLVVHSMTKGLGGHGDAIGGAIAGSKARVDAARDVLVKGLGGVMSPFGAYLLSRGLITFALRQRQACSSAARIARLLEDDASVSRVHHPSLPSHPGHTLARAQMHAMGTIVAFELHTAERARRVLESVKLITHAVSLGDARSLITHPASTTHASMPAADRARAGIADGLLRLSVGLESHADLEQDLAGALRAAAEPARSR